MSAQVSVHPRIQAARSLCEKLRQENYAAFWVGGAVRDLILQPEIAPNDIDIATDAPFKDICKLLPQTRAIGKAFGVGLVTLGDNAFEVATFRKESDYADRRHPSQVGAGTLEEDSERRDFTINALYFDPLDDVVVDFHDGMNDIKSRVLRCVGDPKVRLHEDPLRILRLFRFAVKFNFSIDKETLQAAHLLATELVFISKERVFLEVSKLSPASISAFADSIRPLQSALIGLPQSARPPTESQTREISIKHTPESILPHAGSLFVVLCASNEGFSARSWPKAFKDWPLSSEERAQVELFQRIGEGVFVIPQTDNETEWKKFLENFRWLQRQSRISVGVAAWLAEALGTAAFPAGQSLFISQLTRTASASQPQISIDECIEHLIQRKARPLREKVQHTLDSSAAKTALGWARLIVDCSILFETLTLNTRNLPHFFGLDDDEKIASLCDTAMRWSQTDVRTKKV